MKDIQLNLTKQKNPIQNFCQKRTSKIVKRLRITIIGENS